jgi:hypothetical protein
MNSIKDIQKLFVERLNYFAAQNEVSVSDIKVLIYFDKDGSQHPNFNLNVKNAFRKVLDTKTEVLNIPKWDFLQKEFKLNFAIGVITNALMERLRAKHGECNKSEVRVLFFIKKPEQEVPYIQVLKEGDPKGGEFISWEQLEEIF